MFLKAKKKAVSHKIRFKSNYYFFVNNYFEVWLFRKENLRQRDQQWFMEFIPPDTGFFVIKVT